MTASEKIQYSVETLTAVMRQEHRRLSTGTTLRNYIHKQLALGVEPSHYRIEWLRHGVLEIMGTLEVLAEKFNRAHLNDKISVADLVDVLESTSKTLRMHSGYREN